MSVLDPWASLSAGVQKEVPQIPVPGHRLKGSDLLMAVYRIHSPVPGRKILKP